MTKGDDAVMRQKNKAMRKKLQEKISSSNISARCAAVIAAKKRRKSGTLCKCQGMCFSLPTPSDPFNDRHGKKEVQTKETKKREPLQVNKKAFLTGETAASKKGAKDESHAIVDNVDLINRMVIGSKTMQDKLITSTGAVQRSPIELRKTEIQVDVKVVSNGHQGQACENLDILGELSSGDVIHLERIYWRQVDLHLP